MGCCKKYKRKRRICELDDYFYEYNLSDNIITVIFMPIDQQGEFSFVTNSSELFSNVINEFYEMCPDYKCKNCIFLHNGNIMDQNLTMEQYNCKAGKIRILVIFDNE